MISILRRPYLIFVFLGMLESCSSQDCGCTDPQAINFNPKAIEDDGSCLYDPVMISPVCSCLLGDEIAETSGMIIYDDHLWTHNDDQDTRLHFYDIDCCPIKSGTCNLEGVVNVDWEEISQDEEHIYLGDFGNNASGSRTDLHILRISKQSLRSDKQIIDTISFSYAGRQDLVPSAPNQTEYDCEAFIVAGDSIYLFTKQWLTFQTSVYSLPNRPGHHQAILQDRFNTKGLVTGAVYLDSLKLLVLCGYSSMIQPFLYLLYDFKDHQFFSGNRRRIDLAIPFHQVEAVSTRDGLNYYVTNESFTLTSDIKSIQGLHMFDLSMYLQNYILPLMK